ncbi:MAG: hypothetical protein IT168_29030 [Bryobacterales bacterium]|nr:hypothetical protein [Bryobacterales bacterium]
MDHFQVRLYAETMSGYDTGKAIPVFHRWIQEHALPELLIDVVDYRHVPEGPGVVLIGHDSHYGLDAAGTLFYSRRTAASASVPEKVRAAYEAAKRAAALLEAQPEFAGKLRYLPGRFEISVNDRMLAPNNPETRATLEPEVRSVLDAVVGAGTYSLKHTGDPRGLFTLVVSPR